MIENLKVSNFKGIEKAEVNCKRVTLFVGRNRQGKTSMLTAVGWCIAGGNKPYYVRTGTDEARTVANTERATFDRVLVRGSKKDRVSITKKSDGSIVDASIALANFSEHCFDPIKFIFLDPKIQTKVIREALASKMTLTEQEAEDMGIVLFEQDGTRTTKDAKTLCEDAYKKYYAERTEINRQVDVMKQKMTSSKLDFLPDQHFIDNIEHQVKELQDRYNEQIKKNARIKAAQGSAVTKQKLQDQFNTLESEIVAAQSTVGEGNDQADAIRLELVRKFNKTSTEEAELRGSYNMLKKTLSDLEVATYPVCPISNKIICNTDMSSAKEGMKTELEEMGVKLKALHNSNLALSEEIENLAKHIETKKLLASKIIERDRTNAMLENLNVGDETVEDDEATKQSLNQKQQELTTAKMAKDLAALGDIEEKIKRQRNLDELVKKLRNFIDTELTKRAKLEVNLVEVRDDGIYFKGLPLESESTSVQLRASCAIMKNLFPKNRLITCDRLEILDKDILLQFLKGYAENVDGVQLFGTLVEHYPDQYSYLKDIPEVKLIRMNAGVPTELQ